LRDRLQKMSRYLTKSRFKLAVECPTKLYYTGKDSEYNDLKTNDLFLQSLAEGGFQVGKMATMLYPDGIEITATSNDDAERLTSELLKDNENITLFEPAIRFENLFIRIDILVKCGNQLELIEVKAKSYNSDDPQIEGRSGTIQSNILPYIQDVAFQRYVLAKAMPKATISSYLMMPDKAKIASIDGLNQCFKIKRISERSVEVTLGENCIQKIESCRDILAKVSVDRYVNMVMEHEINFPGGHSYLGDLVETWSRSYKNDERVKPTLHAGCAKCEFRKSAGHDKKSGFHECWREATNKSDAEINEGTVLDIWNYRGKDKLLSQSKYLLNQIDDNDIPIKQDQEGLSNSQRQWMQIRGIPAEFKTNGFYFDREMLSRISNHWHYPLHFIDFETSTSALPFHKGMRPFETVAFQFSHHVMESDGTVRHASEFLCAEPAKFPNFDFVRALKNVLESDNGTIFRWAEHENTVLNHIANQLREIKNPPDDRDQLLSFIVNITKGGRRAMVDLEDLSRLVYFHPDTKGRTSIKKVLPSVLKSSIFLKNTYSRPIYGASIASKNYAPTSWWEEQNGEIIDPYERLNGSTNPVSSLSSYDPDHFDETDANIAEGGAAAAAYAKLQFEGISIHERKATVNALLRYCELDTLAMVMILQSWQNWAGKKYLI
jgi:hypothetical protein